MTLILFQPGVVLRIEAGSAATREKSGVSGQLHRNNRSHNQNIVNMGNAVILLFKYICLPSYYISSKTGTSAI